MLIITDVMPPTDTKGARIKATLPHYGMSVIVSWDFSLESSGTGSRSNYWQAAATLCRKFNESPHAEFAGQLLTLRYVGSTGPKGYAYCADFTTTPETYELAHWAQA